MVNIRLGVADLDPSFQDLRRDGSVKGQLEMKRALASLG